VEGVPDAPETCRVLAQDELQSPKPAGF